MDSENEELYLQNIEEYVMDEDKIVTVTWLSKKLSISAGESKRLLTKYLIDHRNSSPNTLFATFIITAVQQDDNLVVGIVKETELNEKMKLFKKTLNKQIYSVQKNNQVDFVSIGLVDSFEVYEDLDTPIKDGLVSKKSHPRVLRPKAGLLSPSKAVVKEKSSTVANIFNSSNKLIKSTKSENKETLSSGNSNSNAKKVISKNQALKCNKNGFASFFSQCPVKTEIIDKKNKEEPMELENKSISSIEKPPDAMQLKDKLKTLVDSDSDEDMITDAVEIIQKNTPIKSKVIKNRKRPCKDSKTENSRSKRLKKLKSNSSDSDDIFESNEDNDLENMLEDLQEEAQLPQVKVLAPKNKKRKYVDRTFTDEEGFVITRKEWIEESASEGESNLEETALLKTKKEISKAETQDGKMKMDLPSTDDSEKNFNVKGPKRGSKIKKVTSGNQLTLMNFFQKQ